MTKTFKPFPIGTVRGPFACGKGNDPRGGVQYCVQTKNGWVYFIGKAVVEEAEMERQAIALSREVIRKEILEHFPRTTARG